MRQAADKIYTNAESLLANILNELSKTKYSEVTNTCTIVIQVLTVIVASLACFCHEVAEGHDSILSLRVTGVMELRETVI